MTSDEMISLLKAAKALGAAWLRAGDLEVMFGSEPKPMPVVTHFIPASAPLIPEEDQEIKHKVEELTSVMKLSDAELLDSLFPIPKEEIEEGL